MNGLPKLPLPQELSSVPQRALKVSLQIVIDVLAARKEASSNPFLMAFCFAAAAPHCCSHRTTCCSTRACFASSLHQQ